MLSLIKNKGCFWSFHKNFISENNTNCIIEKKNLNLTEPKINDDLAVLNLKFENLSNGLKEDVKNKIKLLKQVEKYIEGGLK